MCNTLLKNQIKKFQDRDMTVFVLIYKEYDRLIHYYSNKLGGDDAFQELTVFLTELLYSINISDFPDGTSQGLHRYIAVCLRNKYIALSKEYSRLALEGYQVSEAASFSSDIREEKLYIEDALKKLSEKQRLIIVYRYIYNYTDIEISNMLGISRQAVNRIKNRGLDALRRYYTA